MAGGKRKLLGPSVAPPERPTPPTNWPPDIVYIDQLVYSAALTSEELSTLTCAPQTTNVPMTEIPASERIEIRRINSPIGHPAFDQHGLFAAQDLEPDTIIIDYMGFVHSSRDADPSSTYDLSLDRELDLGVDSTKMGNEARFINDYRGIRERPNADFRERVVRGQRRMSVWVMPAGKSGKGRKGVRKGEEIVVSYGKGFWAREAVVNHEDEWDSHDPEHEHVGHLP